VSSVVAHGQSISTQAITELDILEANLNSLNLQIEVLKNQTESDKILLESLQNQTTIDSLLLLNQKESLQNQRLQLQALETSYLFYKKLSKYIIPTLIIESGIIIGFLIYK
jgi:hypothetical protein